MNKFKKFIVFTLLTVTLIQPAAMADRWDDKFTRGITNMLTAPFELFRQPFKLRREREYSVGHAFIAGIFTGIYATVVRELAGIYEVVTFPFPWPAGYRSVIDPPTVFDGPKVPRDYKS